MFRILYSKRKQVRGSTIYIKKTTSGFYISKRNRFKFLYSKEKCSRCYISKEKKCPGIYFFCMVGGLGYKYIQKKNKIQGSGNLFWDMVENVKENF
eukprot:snap_masked-scaffold_70-processed-gene-0.32-mRNA-1 protein AED:1.00 eAED:1.00 QI:0/-1/0/0/-1/1/1/0/95